MKTRNLLITLSVAALATINVMAADALLSPRAADNQIKIASGSNNDPNLAVAGLNSASPRLLDNQVKTVAGKDTGAAPMSCAKQMAGTPKTIGVCAEHPGATMSCCSGMAKK